MGLLLTAEVAGSETKFTQSGSWQKISYFFFFIRIPDAEHVRHLRLQHTNCAAQDCGWASSLGQGKNTHRCMRILHYLGRDSHCGLVKVALSSECHHAAVFYSFWLFGYRASSMKMTDSDIGSTKSRCREDMAPSGLHNLHAFRSKQSQETRLLYGVIFFVS